MAKTLLAVLFFIVFSAVVRCHNWRDIFIDGRVYFVDADCYSRMTRVRLAIKHPLAVIRHHDFENWPRGVEPHTTMPMDWLIALLKKFFDFGFSILDFFGKHTPWKNEPLDLAGAFVSPLAGVATVLFVWFWSRNFRFGAMAAFLVATSPILVHGTVLGRPDHQSLLIFLLAIAIGAETNLAREPSKNWAMASGAAWALALWVSIYEPLILLATVVAMQLAFFRARFFARERHPGFFVFAAICIFAMLIERWHFQMPDATLREFFPRWEKTIGELARVSIFSPALFRWCGFALVVAPVLLMLRARAAREGWILFAVLAVSFSFTLNQQRWGYFFALVFAMSLPVALENFRQRWMGWLVWPVFVLNLWPLAREWDATLFPDKARAAQIAERRIENVQLHDVAEKISFFCGDQKSGVIAPWWFSPAIAYWSGLPCVAGSSHESLAGIVDTARFFLADVENETPDATRKILEERRVRWIVSYDWARTAGQSALLLSQRVPNVSLARMLDERPSSSPWFFKLRYTNGTFKIFQVEANVKP